MALQIPSTIQIDRTVTAGPPAASPTAPDASASTIDVVLRLSRAPFEPVGDVPAAAGEGPADAARVVHVHIDETMLRLVHEIASGAADATAIPSRLSAHKPVLERFTTALDLPGSGPARLRATRLCGSSCDRREPLSTYRVRSRLKRNKRAALPHS